VTAGALNERVNKSLYVTGCLPNPLGKDDGRVQTDDVFTTRDHGPPPLPLDVLF
jgi:hypothetical protein